MTENNRFIVLKIDKSRNINNNGAQHTFRAINVVANSSWLEISQSFSWTKQRVKQWLLCGMSLIAVVPFPRQAAHTEQFSNITTVSLPSSATKQQWMNGIQIREASHGDAVKHQALTALIDHLPWDFDGPFQIDYSIWSEVFLTEKMREFGREGNQCKQQSIPGHLYLHSSLWPYKVYRTVVSVLTLLRWMVVVLRSNNELNHVPPCSCMEPFVLVLNNHYIAKCENVWQWKCPDIEQVYNLREWCIHGWAK